MRKITIYASKGAGHKAIMSGATDWDGLMADFDSEGIDYKGLRVMVGETRNTLESGKAVLPTGPFTIFLMPKKTKSGASFDVETASHSELRAEISAFIERDGEQAKKVFNKDKNYTNKITDELRKLVRRYAKKNNSSTPAKTTSKSTSANESNLVDQFNALSDRVDSLTELVNTLVEERDTLGEKLKEESNKIVDELKVQGIN